MSVDDNVGTNTLTTQDDLGKSPEAIAKRWKLELKLADKRESGWRKKASEIYKIYTPETPANNSFNVLWTNTETLRQSVYNSLPQPQAKRRYSDEDELGKNVANVLSRALEFAQDTYDFDGVLKGDVLSMLLPGRAVSRVRYVPDIREIGGEDSKQDDDSQESESYEEIEWEQVICERVQWDDFRILCAAKVWDDVTAIGFRHHFTRDDLVDKFGEDVGNKIPLNSPEDDDIKKTKDIGDLFKTAEVWEIWDKEEKEVLFICKEYSEPCKVQDDPLSLSGFFPIPRPLYAIENDQSLVPAALYTQYEQQAKELNKVSIRINKLIDICKVRGIYDSTLSELSELMKAGEGDLTPAQNVTAILANGGDLNKSIWMMPINMIAQVLKELHTQREGAKQVIYEITGISDIMRSASDPNETFGAQKIKTQWGTQRLQRMQMEVQRYIRDLIRLKAEIIAEKFQVETLEKMTLVQLPHDAQLEQQKQQLIAQHQQAMQQAQMQGQPPPPFNLPPKPISWEDVKKAMAGDATRTYRIDIETDSTLSASQDSDMQGMQQLLQGLTAFISGVGPAVQAGAVPVEAVKEICMAIVRRAKMGSAVEDALEKMQAPTPPPDPNAGKAQAEQAAQQSQQQHEAALEQMKSQAAMQAEQLKAQANQASEQARMQADNQVEQVRAQASIEIERAKQAAQFQVDEAKRQHELTITQMGHNHAQTIEQYKIDMEYKKAIEVAQIAAGATLQAAQISAANQALSDNQGE